LSASSIAVCSGHSTFCNYVGVNEVVAPSTQPEVDLAIREGKVVATDDAFLLARSSEVDVLVDVTGSVEFGARVAFEAFRHKKDVVLLNAEIDATIGPILQVYAAKHGAILSACDGEKPGVQINLCRWVKGPGAPLRGLLATIKGLQDPYRNPTTQRGFARKVGAESRHGDELCRRLKDQFLNKRSSRMPRVSSCVQEECPAGWNTR